MNILLRTHLFDTTSKIEEGTFYGEDFAAWLIEQLDDWDAAAYQEDWGWAVLATKRKHHYVIGIYDHDTDDVTAAGPQWCMWICNQNDWKSWFRSWVRYTPPKADPEVVDEVLAVLRRCDAISDIRVELGD